MKDQIKQNIFISIAGLIGAGKSTLATALGKLMKLPVYYEPVEDNEYLDDFYNNMPKYAFQMQIFLLNKRFNQQQQIIWNGVGGISDRSIYEDEIFVRMLNKSKIIEDRDYKTYKELSNNMFNFMRRPNVIIYLYVSPEKSLERIKLRNRESEKNITIEYLRSLYAEYEEFIKEIGKTISVIKINWEQLTPVDIVAKKIIEEYNKISVVHQVAF